MVNSVLSNAASKLVFLQVSTDGGTVCTADSQYFPASTAMSGSLVHFKPGALRQMHWHVNEDEWQFVINRTVEVIMSCKLELNAASVHAGILQGPHGNSCVADAACLVVKHNDLNLLFFIVVCGCCAPRWNLLLCFHMQASQKLVHICVSQPATQRLIFSFDSVLVFPVSPHILEAVS